jgi:formate dehydrogenase iron-sulfur subunit
VKDDADRTAPAARHSVCSTGLSGPPFAMADAPDSSLPRSTIRRRRRREGPRSHAVEAEQATSAHPNERLVVTLVATQLAIGLLAAALAATAWLPYDDARSLATGGGLVLLAALAIGVLHLRRPRSAWHGFLGLGHSWLSREIVALGNTAVFTVAYAASCWFADRASAVSVVLGAGAVAAGLVGVGCSAMIFHATGRRPWRFRSSGSQFFGTTVLLGTSALALAAGAESVTMLTATCSGVLVVVTALKLGVLRGSLGHTAGRDALPLVRTAELLRGRLWPLTVLRTASGLLGGIVLPLVALVHWTSLAMVFALGLSLVGEGAERALFFRTASPARVPASL